MRRHIPQCMLGQSTLLDTVAYLGKLLLRSGRATVNSVCMYVRWRCQVQRANLDRRTSEKLDGMHGLTMDKATMTEWKVYVAVVSGVLSNVVALFLSPLLLALPFISHFKSLAVYVDISCSRQAHLVGLSPLSPSSPSSALHPTIALKCSSEAATAHYLPGARGRPKLSLPSA